MKHYLLTWYGLTDFRAALGVEATVGPVLSALKTGDYSDAVILAYTDPNKGHGDFDATTRERWQAWATNPVPGRASLPQNEAQQFVDALSNTEAGHQVFIEWLQHQLTELGIEVSIQLVQKPLGHLNDASGIYEAAASAIRLTLQDPARRQVTTYVSPGTPVMAYTWALIARSNPQLNIGVLSSSDSRRPPERIQLPKDLLSPSIGTLRDDAPTRREYDVVLHLLGEQTIPVLFGMRQFKADRNIILTTREYAPEAQNLASVAGIEPAPVIIPDPFTPAATRRAVAEVIASLAPDARIAVNMTGGTKLMFAGALSACWELGLDPFYFEIRHHNVIFLRDGSSEPFVGITNIEDFVLSSGFVTRKNGRWPTDPGDVRNRRVSAAQKVWQERDALPGLYRMQQFQVFGRNYDEAERQGRADDLPFDFNWDCGKASLASGAEPKLSLNGATVELPKQGFFKFLRGGWLEEYVYSLLAPLEDQGVISDLRVGYEPDYPEAGPSPFGAQEFDCTFTDGKRLWIVECKAGVVTQEAIQKLQNILRTYGGVAARGLLVSTRPLRQANRNRIDSIDAITFIEPNFLTSVGLQMIIGAEG